MRFSQVKQKVLKELHNIKPMLKETAEFYLFGSLGYDLERVNELIGGMQIPDIRREEVRGIKDTIRIINSIPDDINVKNTKAGVNLITRALSEMEVNNPFYNFSKERIINIIKARRNKSKDITNNSSLRIIYIGDNEIVIPGTSKRLKRLIALQKKIYWKTFSFLSQIKNYFLKDIAPPVKHFCLLIDNSLVSENFEISKKEVERLVMRKLVGYIKCFFPSLRFEGSRMKTSVFPPLIFLVFTSIDIIFLILLSYNLNQILLFFQPISEYSKEYSLLHINLIQRYIDYLEGNSNDYLFSPLVFWVDKKYLQGCLSPDSKIFYKNDDDVLMLYSNETRFFFQILEEVEPYYRVTLLPVEYLEKIFVNRKEARSFGK